MPQSSIADLLSGAANPYVKAERSPDGRYALVIASNEMRMSHWIDSVALFTFPDERLLGELGGWAWSADRIDWSPAGHLTIALRRYPGDVPGVTVEIALDRATACFGDGPEIPIGELSAALEADYLRRGGRG
ncbi:MAG TPA: hypothetical protein VKS60_15785 [Stellaceae bacterium]|nr:hypothetical protein [Stellaceae bacterium]